MPNKKSALKRVRQTKKKTAINNMVRSSTSSAVKKAINSINNKDKNYIDLLYKAISMLNKASSKGVIPKKRASRKISRLSTFALKLGLKIDKVSTKN